MPRKPDFYDNSNYQKVMFVIDKDVYAEMRRICDKDPKRTIKAGDVIQIMMELINEHVPKGIAEERFERAREAKARLTNRDITKAIPKLTPEQRAAIEKIIAGKA